MLERIVDSLLQFSIIEWLGLITGVIYVILSAKNKVVCWLFGIISCACIAYHDFFGGLNLYSDGILQIFYILMGFYGIYEWRKNTIVSDTDISNQNLLRNHLIYIAVACILSLIYGYLMGKFTDAYFPLIDAFTTVFSVLATFLLVYRQLSAWMYFVAINIVMMTLYYLRSAELFAFLYLIFTVVAIYGVWNWRRIYRMSKQVI